MTPRWAPAGIRRALATGRERLAAWSDLLDRINVFPVADGDTGRNLLISLAPLGKPERPLADTAQALLLSARGNSGNIAAQFFRGWFGADPDADLAAALERGRLRAWQAVADPKPGTMLSLFDALAAGMAGRNGADLRDAAVLDAVLDGLEGAVIATREQLPALSRAGVVDAGALGMNIFFDGVLNALGDRGDGFRRVAERFAGTLRLGATFAADHKHEDGFCVDAVLRADRADALLAELSAMGESVVSMREGALVKIHLHTKDLAAVRGKLEAGSRLIRFSTDDLHAQTEDFVRPNRPQAIHVMTDAAGSVSRADAKRLGLTLLDSYINLGEQSVPETHLRPDDLYAAMRAGVPVSTAQASDFERYQHYQKALAMHDRVLYVCVGAAFTGNYDVVRAFKGKHDPDDRLVVLDSEAASGKLALIALAAAEQSLATDDPEAVIALARRAIPRCREWIFLDQLKYLAAGGRLSKGSAFFGDLLHMKPVVSPTAEGAQKVAVLRNTKAQLAFARERLAEVHAQDGPGTIMLAHTDNRGFLESRVAAAVREQHPDSEIIIQPVSLTSGVHMGPGTWAVAYLPRLAGTEGIETA